MCCFTPTKEPDNSKNITINLKYLNLSLNTRILPKVVGFFDNQVSESINAHPPSTSRVPLKSYVWDISHVELSIHAFVQHARGALLSVKMFQEIIMQINYHAKQPNLYSLKTLGEKEKDDKSNR